MTESGVVLEPVLALGSSVMTTYSILTATAALRGEPFEAETDEAALDVVRSRKRSGNLPLTSFSLQTSDDRTVASWIGAHEVV
ncbi:MAG: hypothetical protein K0R97_1072 [Oerskovia sp.]|nr:hypothetical protein [Oerskovia sp.]